MEQNLFLFPDTNLFIQCKDLRELNWSEWKDFTEVHLIVCLPVQQEIDQQKSLGKNSRVGRRARKTYSSLFRPIATGEKEYALIRNGDPKVKLFLESPSWPDPELSDRLDYSKPDNIIVGCLSRYAKANSETDVRLLTHDTGPMMTAKGLGLSVAPINDEWVLPPEHNKVERENVRLKNEIIQLKKSEPSFHIVCFDEDDTEVQKLEMECRVYEPLGDGDLDELLELLKRVKPMVTDFGDKKNSGRPTISNMNAIVPGPFVNPPSAREIAEYTATEYPEWIQDCRAVLSNLHESLQRRLGLPRIRFAIKNSGTRPGRDTLIEFRAQGQFKLVPPQDDHPDWSNEEEDVSLRLPPPPEPPRSRSFAESLSNIGSLDFLASSIHTPDPSDHDHNAFYYKPEFPEAPTHLISLACDQWRHGNEYEDFFVEIFADDSSGEAAGLLECVVQAENLSSPATKCVPIEINIIKMNTRDYAHNLVCGQL